MAHKIRVESNGMKCPACLRRIRHIDGPKGATGFHGYEIEAERVPGSTRYVYRPINDVECVPVPRKAQS